MNIGNTAVLHVAANDRCSGRKTKRGYTLLFDAGGRRTSERHPLLRNNIKYITADIGTKRRSKLRHRYLVNLLIRNPLLLGT